jgi:heme/copper-type cytochrome/quinol oxidase subunit 4
MWRVVERIRQGRVVQWGVGFLISVYLALAFLLSGDFYPAWLRIALALCVIGLYLAMWFWLPKGTSEKPAENTVQLGFGTLIIIGLIVMFFSGGRDSEQLRNRVGELNQKIDRLEQKIDKLYKLSREVHPQSASTRTSAKRE